MQLAAGVIMIGSHFINNFIIILLNIIITNNFILLLKKLCKIVTQGIS